MAAAALNLDRWETGARLMESDNPRGWARIVEGAKLERQNRAALEECWNVATRIGKAQRCNVMAETGSGGAGR